VLGLVACGDDAGSPTTTKASTITTAAAAAATDSTAADRGFIGSADSAACRVDERTLEVAIDAFQALNNRLPASQAELVAAGFLRELSTNYEVEANGSVVPLDSGRCT